MHHNRNARLLSCTVLLNRYKEVKLTHFFLLVFSTSPIPGTLHACNESRRVATEAGWTLAFGETGDWGRIWFNFERDVLYIPGCCVEDFRVKLYVLNQMTNAQRVSIRRLVRKQDFSFTSYTGGVESAGCVVKSH